MARIVDELQNIADKLASLNITANVTTPNPLDIKVVDNNGIPIGLKHVNNKIRVSSMPYVYDIAEGNVPNHFSHSSFGRALMSIRLKLNSGKSAELTNSPGLQCECRLYRAVRTIVLQDQA